MVIGTYLWITVGRYDFHSYEGILWPYNKKSFQNFPYGNLKVNTRNETMRLQSVPSCFSPCSSDSPIVRISWSKNVTIVQYSRFGQNFSVAGTTGRSACRATEQVIQYGPHFPRVCEVHVNGLWRDLSSIPPFNVR